MTLSSLISRVEEGSELASASVRPEPNGVEAAVIALGEPHEWSAKLNELYSWSGSAFLAGEKVKDEADHKVRLYGFLCGLIGYLMAGRDAAAALEDSKAGLADATKKDRP
jgi:hypothetical protein